jgi:hypothetical protein
MMLAPSLGLVAIATLVSGCGGNAAGGRAASPVAAMVVSLTAPEIVYPTHMSNRLPDRLDATGARRSVKFVYVGLQDNVAKIKCIAYRDQANLGESAHVSVGVDAGKAFSGLSVRWSDTALTPRLSPEQRLESVSVLVCPRGFPGQALGPENPALAEKKLRAAGPEIAKIIETVGLAGQPLEKVIVFDTTLPPDYKAADGSIFQKHILDLVKQALDAAHPGTDAGRTVLHDTTSLPSPGDSVVLDVQLQASALTLGPGPQATDERVPELGDNLGILATSKMTLADAIQQGQRSGPVIEAKFELDDKSALSVSVYPTGQPLDVDAERNVFQELSGDPAAPFSGSLAVFDDQVHLLRSARDLTLVQLSRVTLPQAVDLGSRDGFVYWTVPTIRQGRVGYGVYAFDSARTVSHYIFVDGGGSRTSSGNHPADLGTGPGPAATDTRVPELGTDLGILRTSKITMAQALAQVEQQFGDLIEAKFELDDQKHLSLSIYPVSEGVATDAERNRFYEVAGDPTATPFAPTLAEFTVPDVAHVTRSSRDLTLVQIAGLSLKQAVEIAQSQLPDGFVFWAIPTIRDTRAGYGVYIQAKDGTVHYFFVS